jgi:hypothetical protein
MINYSYNHIISFTLRAPVAVTFTGLMPFLYILQTAIDAMAGEPIEVDNQPKNAAQAVFFYLKTLISAAVLDFSVISGLIDFSFVS